MIKRKVEMELKIQFNIQHGFITMVSYALLYKIIILLIYYYINILIYYYIIILIY